MGHYDCKDCDASPHEEHSAGCGRFSEAVTAVASSHGRSGKSLDSLGADGQEVRRIDRCSPGSVQYRLEELREWIDQRCPEGVSGTVENAEWLLSFAEELVASDLRKRLIDAVTLLYTHGVITDKMRAHARQNL